MTKRYRVEFTPTDTEILEAMYMGANMVLRGWAGAMSVAVFLANIVALPLLAVLLFFLVPLLAGYPPPELTWPVIVFLAFIGAAGPWVMGFPYRRLARHGAQSRFNQSATVDISLEGFTHLTPDSSWRTGWRDIGAVAEGKDVICVLVSALVLIVPKRAFASPEVAQEALLAMQAWQREASDG